MLGIPAAGERTTVLSSLQFAAKLCQDWDAWVCCAGTKLAVAGSELPNPAHTLGLCVPTAVTAAEIRGTGRRCWSRRAGGKRIKQQMAGSARGGLAQPGTDLLPSAPHPAGWERAAAQQAPRPWGLLFAPRRGHAQPRCHPRQSLYLRGPGTWVSGQDPAAPG